VKLVDRNKRKSWQDANMAGYKISYREVVRFVTRDLSTDEIRSLYIAGMLENENAPSMPAAQKAQALFTQNNGRQMHTDAIRELGTILAERKQAGAE
jgi:hypothetical protein